MAKKYFSRIPKVYGKIKYFSKIPKVYGGK